MHTPGEAYNGIELTLPNGVKVVAKPLRLDRALHYLDVIDSVVVAGASRRDIRELLENFPEEIGLKEEINEFMPAEVVAIARDFFGRTPQRERAAEPEPETTDVPEIGPEGRKAATP